MNIDLEALLELNEVTAEEMAAYRRVLAILDRVLSPADQQTSITRARAPVTTSRAETSPRTRPKVVAAPKPSPKSKPKREKPAPLPPGIDEGDSPTVKIQTPLTVRIPKFLAAKAKPMAFKEIVEAMGASTGSVGGTLSTLIARGEIERLESGVYVVAS